MTTESKELAKKAQGFTAKRVGNALLNNALIIIMLVVAERFLYKQKHRMMVKAAEKELEFRNQQAAKEAE